jgi:hypothetical protein
LKIILDDQVTEKAVRADLAWELFFRSKTAMPKGHGEPLLSFANWFWDELGKKGGAPQQSLEGRVEDHHSSSGA